MSEQTSAADADHWRGFIGGPAAPAMKAAMAHPSRVAVVVEHGVVVRIETDACEVGRLRDVGGDGR